MRRAAMFGLFKKKLKALGYTHLSVVHQVDGTWLIGRPFRSQQKFTNAAKKVGYTDVRPANRGQQSVSCGNAIRIFDSKYLPQGEAEL